MHFLSFIVDTNASPSGNRNISTRKSSFPSSKNTVCGKNLFFIAEQHPLKTLKTPRNYFVRFVRVIIYAVACSLRREHPNEEVTVYRLLTLSLRKRLSQICNTLKSTDIDQNKKMFMQCIRVCSP